jgi:hypothetical protein
MSVHDRVLKSILYKIQSNGLKIDYVKIAYNGDILFNESQNAIITQGVIFDLSGIIYIDKDWKIIDLFLDFIKNQDNFEIINGRKCLNSIDNFKKLI